MDTNLTVGGLFGYSSVNDIVSLNVPSSKGVSCGLTINIFTAILTQITNTEQKIMLLNIVNSTLRIFNLGK